MIIVKDIVDGWMGEWVDELMGEWERVPRSAWRPSISTLRVEVCRSPINPLTHQPINRKFNKLHFCFTLYSTRPR